MPYIHDPENRPNLGYQHQLARSRFSIEILTPASQEVFELLQQLAVKGVRCSYNGGGDEGFAHFEAAILDDRELNLNTLKQQLIEGPLSRLQGQESIPNTYGADYYNQLTPEERVRERLDVFAIELASCLLGDGYGTGELSLYGSFYAELETGDINDEQESAS